VAEQVDAGPAGERGGVLSAVLADAAAEGRKLGDPIVDPLLGAVQELGDVRADRLVRAAEVGAREQLDLLDR
jgi:hypothetical protein